MVKRALLVGSSFSAAPMLFKLKQRGIRVAVCGSVASDPCHQYADDSYYIDYSNREALLDLVQSEAFDYIVPTCNDYSYMSAAWVAGLKGFPGFDVYDVAEKLHTKDAFRRVTAACGTPAPKAIWIKLGEYSDIADGMFPLLVKPVDSFSGRGVSKVDEPASLPDALEAALASSRSGTAVVEQFVDGTLHSHSAFIKGGRIEVDFFVDEFCTVYPYQVNCSNHPSRLTDGLKDAVRAAMNQLVAHLNLADGLLHTQFITDGSAFWVIECMRRCPGDLYGGLIERSLGLDYTDWFVRPFIGESVCTQDGLSPQRLVGRHTISVDQEVVVQSFSWQLASDRAEIVPLKGSGEILRVAPYDKLGIVFVDFDQAHDMVTLTPKLQEFACIQGWNASGDVNGGA